MIDDLQKDVDRTCDRITEQVRDAFVRGGLLGMLALVGPAPAARPSLDDLRQQVRQALPAAPEEEPAKKPRARS